MTHQCDALQCQASVAAGKFMCTRHWLTVSSVVRNTISRRYRACRQDYAFLSDRQYLEACIQAIEQVAKDEELQLVQTSYHRLLRSVEAKEKRDA